MPKNQVSDPITDQEIAFAHLILSGTMTDRRAAESAGLNPDTAAYTKAKPRVRAYMLEHRAAVQERLVQEETEGLRRLNVGREQVLTRLWEIANLSPEMTRNSVTSQVKALSMIVAIEGLIPDRRAASSKNGPPPPKPEIYKAEWLRKLEAKTADPEPGPDLVRDEEESGVPAPSAAADAPPPPSIPPSPLPDPVSNYGESAFANRFQAMETPSAAFAPDTREPFSIKRRFGPRR